MYRYVGNRPASARRDAKYSIVYDEESPDGFAVRLTYWEDNQDYYLLTTQDHEDLVKMVNDVKVAVTGTPGGAFYVNEHRQVLVPAGGDYFFGGPYTDLLTFDFGGRILSPQAPSGLQPGLPWEGPRPGIPYVLSAGGQDVYYDEQRGRDAFRRVRLSSVVGEHTARMIAAQLREFVGSSGGRVYINEAREFFMPQDRSGYGGPLYLGPLGDASWFEPGRIELA